MRQIKVGGHLLKQVKLKKNLFVCLQLHYTSNKESGSSIMSRLLTESVSISWTPSKMRSTMAFKTSAFPTNITYIFLVFSFDLFTLSHSTISVRHWFRTSIISPADLDKETESWVISILMITYSKTMNDDMYLDNQMTITIK